MHRSQNRVITLGSSKLRKQNFDQKIETWFSNPTDPFKQVGTFQKVVPIVEELKYQLENTAELTAESQKLINEIRRNPQNIYVRGENPERTWKSISRGIVGLKGDGVEQSPSHATKSGVTRKPGTVDTGGKSHERFSLRHM